MFISLSWNTDKFSAQGIQCSVNNPWGTDKKTGPIVDDSRGALCPGPPVRNDISNVCTPSFSPICLSPLSLSLFMHLSLFEVKFVSFYLFIHTPYWTTVYLSMIVIYLFI